MKPTTTTLLERQGTDCGCDGDEGEKEVGGSGEAE